MNRTSLRSLLFVFVLLSSTNLLAAERYQEIVNRMNALKGKYPLVSHIFSIGTNDDNVPLYAMRVSLTPTEADPEKVAHLVVGTHHGNELAAPQSTMHLLEKVLEKYTSRALFDENLDDREFVFIPVLNVSGYNSANRHEKGRDPNRDYAGPCHSSLGGKLKSVRALTSHLTSRIYTGGITIHGYVGALTYPWGVNVANPQTLDQNTYEKNVRNAASLNGYRHGTSTDIVYPVDGAFEDYIYWKHGIWSMLVELRDGSKDDIEKTSDAMWAFLEALDSSPSIKNQLTSACSRAGHLDLHNE